MDWPADRVERRATGSLVGYARNARLHTDDQVGLIAAAIGEWGWTNPVLIDEAGGIIAGHGRVLAAQKLGLPEVPVMVAAGWSEAQRRAYVLADNQLAARATWDMGLVGAELDDLRDAGFDVGLIGFEDDGVGERGSIKVDGVAVGPVKDRFWVSVRGPLADQARALAAISGALQGLREVEVELGTTAVD